MIQMVGAAWLMTLLSSSERMVALVQSSVTLPIMLGSIAAGVLADGYDRRQVMLHSQIFMLAVSAILAALTFAGLMTPWLLLAFTFLIGLGQALHNPSWQASFRDLVPREDVPSAVSAHAMGMNMTRSVGPAIGGVIVGAAGAAAAFLINAITYVAIIFMLARWQPGRVPSKLPRERFSSALSAGFRYFLMSPVHINCNLRGMVFGLAAIAILALLPLVARDSLNGGAFTFGVLLAAFGLGAVAGALLTATLRRVLSVEGIFRLGAVTYAAASVIIAFSGSVILTTLAAFVAGVFWLINWSLINIVVQTSSPGWVLGRMISLFMTCIFAGMALGGWIWGEVAEVSGLAHAFTGSAIVLLLSAIAGFIVPLPQHGADNLDPMGTFNEPAIRLDLARRSGPILIMVEYEIAQPDITEFLATMARRRRMRIRDGARNWSILRDLEDPDRWVESYHFPTWTDYVRHAERRTVADDEVIGRLHELHRGARPLKVHRMIERQTVHAEDDTPRIDPEPDHMP